MSYLKKLYPLLEYKNKKEFSLYDQEGNLSITIPAHTLIVCMKAKHNVFDSEYTLILPNKIIVNCTVNNKSTVMEDWGMELLSPHNELDAYP